MPVDAPVEDHSLDPGDPSATHSLGGHLHARPIRLPGFVTIASWAIAWAIVVALLVVIMVRLIAWDASEPFAVLNTVTAFVYLPAWLVVVAAAVGRRPFLLVAALVVVIAQIAFMIPELTAAQPVPAWAAGAQQIRLFDANVYAYNPSMSGYAREITALRPDVVTLEESNPADVTQLDRAGALAGLRYRIQIKRHDPRAFLVASRYPLTNVHVVTDFGRPLIVQATVILPSGSIVLWVVHTVAPLPPSFANWKGELATIGTNLRARGPQGLLLVGDFNSTWGSKGFRQLLDDGMSDGAAARGKAFDMTWSQIESLVPPLVRIDHVLTGPGLAVTKIATGDGPGSDHRDLAVTVAVRRSTRS
jgi:endonuclease/exonuclease/phosphatase (EEP) superfamily protein YafD